MRHEDIEGREALIIIIG